MKTYLIELSDGFKDDNGKTVYRALGCNTLIFDENGIKNILKPFNLNEYYKSAFYDGYKEAYEEIQASSSNYETIIKNIKFGDILLMNNEEGVFIEKENSPKTPLGIKVYNLNTKNIEVWNIKACLKTGKNNMNL